MDEVQFGSETIRYEVSYVKRKTLGITVTPEMEVLVKAPEETSLEKVREKVVKRAPWILNQRSFFLAFHPRITKRQYVSGETFFYLGRQYLLKVSASNLEEVRFTGRYIEVLTSEKKNAEALLDQWYRQRARLKFEEISGPLIEKFRKYEVEPSDIRIQKMPMRWGSCSPRGRIILNPELVKAPRPCIEYVITHELCHLVHRNHTRAFFELQAREMPDWEKWKNKLENLLA